MDICLQFPPSQDKESYTGIVTPHPPPLASPTASTLFTIRAHLCFAAWCAASAFSALCRFASVSGLLLESLPEEPLEADLLQSVAIYMCLPPS